MRTNHFSSLVFNNNDRQPEPKSRDAIIAINEAGRLDDLKTLVNTFRICIGVRWRDVEETELDELEALFRMTCIGNGRYAIPNIDLVLHRDEDDDDGDEVAALVAPAPVVAAPVVEPVVAPVVAPAAKKAAKKAPAKKAASVEPKPLTKEELALPPKELGALCAKRIRAGCVSLGAKIAEDERKMPAESAPEPVVREEIPDESPDDPMVITRTYGRHEAHKLLGDIEPKKLKADWAKKNEKKAPEPALKPAAEPAPEPEANDDEYEYPDDMPEPDDGDLGRNR